MDEDLGVTMQLVRRAQAGDRDALNELFKRYQDKVHRIASIRLGKALRSRIDSHDILQEALESAVRSFDQFEIRDQAAFIDWIAKLVENRIRDNVDRHFADKRDIRRDQPQDSGDESVPPCPETPSRGPTPSEDCVRRERVRLVDEAIGRLSERSRELIIARQFLDLPWKDVAARLGDKTPDAVRMAFGKAMLELADELRGIDGLDEGQGRAKVA